MGRPTGRRIVGWLAAIALSLSGLAAVTLAAPAPRARAAAAADIPLLLVHGFNDDCGAAWKTAGTDSNGNLLANSDSAMNFLGGQGFGDIRTVGYYTSSDNNTDAQDNASGVCDVNLQNQPALAGVPSQASNFCNELPDITGHSIAFGTKDEPIDRLACLLAWYIYDDYTQYGTPVNVLAHSMGGLMLRYALGATDAGVFGFPPHPLWVVNAVTVATPHGGIGGPYHLFASLNNNTNGVELDDMNPGSTFMNTIAAYQAPQGYLGTHWALMGASDGQYDSNQLPVNPGFTTDGGNQVSFITGFDGDGVVASDSQLAMTANYKVLYGVQDAYTLGDKTAQYEHETGMGCFGPYPVVLPEKVCFNGANGGYYLNDTSTATTTAWTCSGCAGTPGTSMTTTRSLVTIANQLQAVAPPALPARSIVLRSNASNKFVSAELGYATTSPLYGMLRARADVRGPWESWTEVELPSGNVALRNDANGLYVSAELGYTGSDYAMLRARASTIGEWEMFTVIANSDGTFSLESASNGNNDYVSAELGYTGPHYGELRARASAIGPWEKFNSSTAPSVTEQLGAPDWNGYCAANGRGTATLVLNNAYGWFCSADSAGLDGQAVCAWTYSSSNVANRIGNFSDPNSWQCWRSMNGELGTLNWNTYCQDLGYPGAQDRGLNDAYTWTCQNSGNVNLDAQAACNTLYPAFAPLTVNRFQNFYDKNSWQCWG